ncbi:hypothetical protein E2542_SST20441 [Spatholobus suberectus]|nr:hypothetical protein E2542_SST20441 [Spatholobus suberectus]
MDYDFITRPPPYNSSSTPTTHQMYPKINPHGHAAVRSSPHHHHRHSSPPSSSPGLGIRVFIKQSIGSLRRILDLLVFDPQCLCPHLLPHSGDIPRSNFQFDFGLEKKILAEANKENPNWSKFGMENLPTKVTEPASPKVSVSDPIVSKYIAMGLSREAVPIAVANYGDNPAKVCS